MEKEYNVTEIKLKKDKIKDWIKRLEKSSDKEHVHLEYDNGEIIVHLE
jgi:transcriptional regulator